MQYMGGKARIAGELETVMLSLSSDRDAYLEPFVGAAWVLARMAPHFKYVAAGDVMPDLIELWTATQLGWMPPTTLTREKYAELRTAEPSALRAFAGFGCSFGGKWFGGYASNGRGDDFAGAARRGIMRKVPALAEVRFRQCGYDKWKFDPSRVVIYCDPPYAGTTVYAGAEPWDADRFWVWAEKVSRAGALVFVSEYAAPVGWVSVWSKTIKGSLSADTNTAVVTEQLFKLET